MVVVFNKNKHPVQDDEYNYDDSPQAHLSDSSTVDLVIYTKATIASGLNPYPDTHSIWVSFSSAHFSPLPFTEATDI